MNMPMHIMAKPIHMTTGTNRGCCRAARGWEERVRKMALMASTCGYPTGTWPLPQPPNQKSEEEPIDFYGIARQSRILDKLHPLGFRQRTCHRNLSIMADHRMEAPDAAA